MIPIFVGYDPREAINWPVFTQSIIETSSVLPSFIPLHSDLLGGFDGQQDGTNAFIFSRYLVPHIVNEHYKNIDWAIFADGDMVCTEDIKELWDLRDDKYAVMVVKHDYKTKYGRKYIDTPMENRNVDYPRKNWSSLILWNCAHPKNRILTPQLVSEAGGGFLHRFSWLRDEEIGELPKKWNWLVGEYPNKHANLYHYTLGVPSIPHYKDFPGASHWFDTLERAVECAGEEVLKQEGYQWTGEALRGIR